ncbi:MAG TPA: carboxypeptidase-like regulatory domain-containing protein [Gemmatimonadaceae bacterium]
MRGRLATTLSVVLTASLHAQAGSFGGSVLRDTLGNGIARAEVQIPDAHLTTATDPTGSFAFSNVSPGRHAIVVRAVGFELLVDTIDVAAGQRLEADIVLHVTPVNLATVKTIAPAEKRLPFGLDEMEDRRKSGLGGYFVTDSMLRKNDDRKLTYFLAEIPGLQLSVTPVPGIASAGTAVYLKGGHNVIKCYVEVYLDGAVYYRGPPSEANPPPDFNTLWANGYSGIEFYPGAASVPTQYNATHKEDCGTMLLWTRRTPF